MVVKELTDWTFAEELASRHRLTAVLFVAAGDDEGEALTGLFFELSERYGHEAHFFELDLFENPSLARKLRIHRLPTVILYEDGIEARRFAGPEHGDDIEAAVRESLHSQESGDV